MRELSQLDTEVIGACLRAAADGPFFEDWEFASLFGLERVEVRRIAGAWPDLDADLPEVSLAIQNSLVNLLGYPHTRKEKASAYVPGGSSAIEAVLARWMEGSQTTPASGS